jgi:hypothetical protein
MELDYVVYGRFGDFFDHGVQSFMKILSDVLSAMSVSKKVRSVVSMGLSEILGPHVPVKNSKIPYLPC